MADMGHLTFYDEKYRFYCILSGFLVFYSYVALNQDASNALKVFPFRIILPQQG